MGVYYVGSFYGTLCVPKGDLVQLPSPMPSEPFGHAEPRGGQGPKVGFKGQEGGYHPGNLGGESTHKPLKVVFKKYGVLIPRRKFKRCPHPGHVVHKAWKDPCYKAMGGKKGVKDKEVPKLFYPA